jgi:hypothetical protein
MTEEPMFFVKSTALMCSQLSTRFSQQRRHPCLCSIPKESQQSLRRATYSSSALKVIGQEYCRPASGGALRKEGLDIDVFSHPIVRQKIVVARNVYGDDANLVLDAFYRKGIRRVLYIGTAGAIADYQIGDVVIPGQFVDGRGTSIDFDNNAAHHYEPELASLLTVHRRQKHGWVQSLFHETKQLLLDWRERSVVSVDIEGLYLGWFAMNHKDLNMAVLLVISDQTLGESTIEESNAYRDVIDASVDKLQAFFLPKVARPTESN